MLTDKERSAPWNRMYSIKECDEIISQYRGIVSIGDAAHWLRRLAKYEIPPNAGMGNLAAGYLETLNVFLTKEGLKEFHELNSSMAKEWFEKIRYISNDKLAKIAYDARNKEICNELGIDILKLPTWETLSEEQKNHERNMVKSNIGGLKK